MSFASEASKLLTNKYFLYFMLFLAITNVLGYLVTNKKNAIIFFALISLLTYQFSKNMAVVLLVAVVATNFLMANKGLREGLENNSTDTNTTTSTTTPALNNIEDKDKEIAKALPIVKESATNEQVTNALSDTKAPQTISKIVDTNNTDLNNNEEKETNVPQGVGEKITSAKGTKTEHFGPRLDYAATIEQSYQNLDQLLGNDSIKQLTNDTQKLMQQQQNLFNTMNQMVPVLEGAQNMLKGFDIKGLTQSLTNMGGLATAPVTKNN